MPVLFVLFKVFLMVALVRWLIVSDKPWHCVAIWTVLTTIVSVYFIRHGDYVYWLAGAGVTVGRVMLSGAYFGALHALRDSKWWFAVLPLGAVVALF